MAFEAACLLLEIELERTRRRSAQTNFSKNQSVSRRRTARTVNGAVLATFWKSLFKTHAPELGLPGGCAQGEIEDRNYERENERIAQEIC